MNNIIKRGWANKKYADIPIMVIIHINDLLESYTLSKVFNDSCCGGELSLKEKWDYFCRTDDCQIRMDDNNDFRMVITFDIIRPMINDCQGQKICNIYADIRKTDETTKMYYVKTNLNYLDDQEAYIEKTITPWYVHNEMKVCYLYLVLGNNLNKLNPYFQDAKKAYHLDSTATINDEEMAILKSLRILGSKHAIRTQHLYDKEIGAPVLKKKNPRI